MEKKLLLCFISISPSQCSTVPVPLTASCHQGKSRIRIYTEYCLRQVRPGRGGIKLSAAKEQLEKLATCHELPRIILEQRRLAGALAKTVAPLLAVCRQHPKVGLRFLDSYRYRTFRKNQYQSFFAITVQRYLS